MTAKRHFTLFLLALLFAVGCLAKNAVALMAAGNVFVKLGDADAANSFLTSSLKNVHFIIN